MDEMPPLPPELHVSPATWERRWMLARKRADLVTRVQAEQASGLTEAEALATLAPGLARSSYHKWCTKLRRSGLEGLIDRRPGKAGGKLTPAVREAIAIMRQADSDISVERIAAVLTQRFAVTLSDTSIKKVLVSEGLNRKPGRKGASLPTKELHFAGGIFLQLADEELGWSAELTDAIIDLRDSLPAPPTTPREPDGRDEQGHFTEAYNQANRKGDAALGPAFRSVEEKREGLDLTVRRAAQDSPATLQRKVRALLVLPLLTDTGRCISLGDYRGGWGIAEFAGQLYRGETLDRFMRDLKYLGASTALCDFHSNFWITHAPAGEEGTPAGTCVYIDGVGKALWTGLFTRSGKVSSAGRIMPCVDQVLIHTGMGTPIFWQSFPGHASLVTQTMPLLDQLEKSVGSGWMADKLLVIDGEGHAAGLFKQLEASNRHFVTILRNGAISREEDVNDLGPWQSFREGDEIAEGWADLPDSHASKAPFRARVILVRRKSGRGFLALASSAPSEYETAFLAEAYFRRWPVQELRFRDFNQGTGFKRIHGYGKRLVQNVTVLGEIDRLRSQKERLQGRLVKFSQQASITREALIKVRRACNAAKARRVRQDGLVQAELAAEAIDRTTLEARFKVTQAERDRLAETQDRLESLEIDLQKQEGEILKAEARLPELEREIAKQESRKEIFQPDTELDAIATTFKLGFAMLCEYLVLTYFAGMRISLHGLMHRLLSLPGSRRIEGKYEHIRIRASRDQDLMLAVEAACARVNERKISRDGHTVRLSVDWSQAATLHGAKKLC